MEVKYIHIFSFVNTLAFFDTLKPVPDTEDEEESSFVEGPKPTGKLVMLSMYSLP